MMVSWCAASPLVVADGAAVPGDPGQGALNDPSAGQDLERVQVIERSHYRSLDFQLCITPHSREIHDAKLEPALRAAAPRQPGPTSRPLASKTPGTTLSGLTRQRWLRPAPGAGAGPGSPGRRGPAAVGRAGPAPVAAERAGQLVRRPGRCYMPAVNSCTISVPRSCS